ncbi:MAG: hypothetical protein LCI00_19240 [Chloroflexi bacterium]|nr:hypothetical protein [Chloroflexota bacterium]MCC6894142.1 hypothetical protein [Anaerolineae bacterium]
MHEREDTSYATNWVNKNDFYTARPDLTTAIEALTDDDMEAIAKDIGDAVAETHDTAIAEILTLYIEGTPHSEQIGWEETVKPTTEIFSVQSMSNDALPLPEYNGWNGNGDSVASARLTWLTFSWLTSDQPIDLAIEEIVNRHEDRGEAAIEVREFVQNKVLGNNPSDQSLMHTLIRNIFQHEINWSEIVKAYVD